MSHQKLGFSDEFSMLLPLDGTHCDGAAFVNIEAVGLTCVHLGVSCAVAM